MEDCGNKTNKCEQCGRYIKRKNWDAHQGSDECRIFLEEEKRKEFLEQQRKLEEIERFKKEEEEQKKRVKEKMELKRQEEQAAQERL